ncbi:MAG TPA: glycoside hydrolase [Caulobacterales bacterium]|nr:glycoside hydrolase [Caulobacterales bacterium]
MWRLCAAACAIVLSASFAWAQSAAPILIQTASTLYRIDPSTLEIKARFAGEEILVMPAMLDPAAGWLRDGMTWRNNAGDAIDVRLEGPGLALSIAKGGAGEASWALPRMDAADTWIVPDGEGLAFAAGDPFWRSTPDVGGYHREHCLSATSTLSMPAWSRATDGAAVTYMLSDGLQSALCLVDNDGVQGRLKHDFSEGAERIELLIEIGPDNALAPALAYRALLQRRGLLKTLADKQVPLLARLYGAQHAYVFGDGRRPEFLDRLRALGIERMLIATDEGPSRNATPDERARVGHAGPDFLARALALGYLAGPYELFGNAQAAATSDDPVSDWGDELYPAGCIRDQSGAIPAGFANRGCNLSSEALRRRTAAPNIQSRYLGHVEDGASTVFVDSDAFGEFFADFSPDHPMTMARDRDNLLARLGIGITQYHFVLGSEHVHAWSHAVAHYSHGSAQAHVMWLAQRDHERFGGWWPPERPGIFFKPVELTPVEARAMFGAAERVPLFEAAFHDSVISTDRWEYSLMKVVGLERMRFARALLYGTPTNWSLDQAELVRVGPWLKAAHDDFRRAHGWDAPVALTGFDWLTPDHLVQQTTFADGRTIVANFSAATWQGLGSLCVRVTWSGRAPFDMCPPDAPAHAR